MHSLTTEISLIQPTKSRNDGHRKKDGKKSPQTMDGLCLITTIKYMRYYWSSAIQFCCSNETTLLPSVSHHLLINTGTKSAFLISTGLYERYQDI